MALYKPSLPLFTALLRQYKNPHRRSLSPSLSLVSTSLSKTMENDVDVRRSIDSSLGESRDEEKDQRLQERKVSFPKLKRHDSLDFESNTISGGHGRSATGVVAWSVILHLAFQSLGIVYGDIGTSPLYVYASTFPNGIKHNDDILGVLSLILYTITLIPLVKYVLVVLRANDNGEGGTFALYSLLCRYAKISLLPSEQAEDQDVSNFKLEPPNNRLRMASKLKTSLENSPCAKLALLFLTMLGTSMVIGDGILTPSISVLSAVGGIKEAKSDMTQDTIVWISAVILILLFVGQRFGTDKVGYTFAPIICLWFAFIAAVGVFNFFKFDPSVIKAVNPKYIVDYFHRNKKDAWISLGGVVLATTGTEALFADVGHFTVKSIQISMCSVTYPALVCAYVGQAAFLRKHSDEVLDTFFKSIPEAVYWPMFVVAVLAAIIASQAMISGTFSIIQQSLALGCFPRVKVVHTSAKYEGQVYIPEINYFLMLACLAVTLGFKETVKIGNAYGIAVVFVMTLTSFFLVLIMIMIWKTHIALIILYVVVIGGMELVYLSSVLYKFSAGGYLPLAFALVLVAIMYTWNDVYRRKYKYELDHKISPPKVKDIVQNTKLSRVDGLAIFYSELVQGIPPIFKHYVDNVPVLHSVLVFVSVKALPIPKVPSEERFLFRRVDPKQLNVFRCVVRYGYTDSRDEVEPFEVLLVEKVKEFITNQFWLAKSPTSSEGEKELSEEIETVNRAWKGGVVHLIGENEVVARKDACITKKILIDYAYTFLKRNLRQSEDGLDIPHQRMLKVGMTYEL